MSSQKIEAVVAGHICLDVIPAFERQRSGAALLAPGKLVKIGAAVTATGGAVSNTGLALHRLGIPTKLMGKIGDDLFGRAVLDLLGDHGSRLTSGMVVSPAEPTSYTIVISPPGIDRSFFHCSGANDTFGADDVDVAELAGARLFHLGYPPLMRRLYLNDGAELARLMAQVQAAGITTSLDMAYPDPSSEAGQLDWEAVLARVLPHVDLFLPSLEEMLLLIDRPRHDALFAAGGAAAHVDGAVLSNLAERLLGMGAAVVMLKLGVQGLYLRTTSEANRLSRASVIPPAQRADWLGRELLAPAFETAAVGNTGAGDCTIAGFLAGLLKGLGVEEALVSAVAVGAFNVESRDATSGIPSWETVQARLATDWERHPVELQLPGWQWQPSTNIWSGPADRNR